MVLDSVVGSGKRLGGDPFVYLKDVLERLPTHPIDRLAELLPDVWFAAHPGPDAKLRPDGSSQSAGLGSPPGRVLPFSHREPHAMSAD